jgi:hypothetical protein
VANDLSAFIPQIWSKRIVQRLNQTNVMLPLVNRDYEGDIQQAGDTVYIRTYGDVAVQDYERNTVLNYSDLAPTKESLTVNTAKSFQFKVDDLDTAQNDINALDGYTERAVVSLNNVVEAFLQGAYTQTNTANQITNGGSAYTISASNAYTVIVAAVAALDTLNVPQSDRWCILTPTFKSFLVRDNTYLIRSTDLGDNIVTSGRIADGQGGMRPPTVREAEGMGFFGRVAGMDLYMSNAVPNDGTARYCMFGQGQPICYAAQLRNMEAIRLETTFATAVRGLLLHGKLVPTEYQKRLGYIKIASSQ